MRLETLYEAGGLPAYDLPGQLRRTYGGTFGFSRPSLYANFVSSLDGVVAMGPDDASAGSTISGGSEADRFVMGLLRACAEAVLVAAGTIRAAPSHLWTPDFICPSEAGAFADLRRRLGRADVPRLVVVTASGGLDPAAAALELGALVLTTVTGGERLRGRLPGASSMTVLGPGPTLDPALLLQAVRAEGHQVVLTEGGPHLIGQLLRAGLLGELFLTLSPVLAGRMTPSQRLGLVEGVELPGADLAWAELAAVRRYRSQLFLRYRLSNGVRPPR